MNIKLCMLYLTAEIVIALETNLLYLHKKITKIFLVTKKKIPMHDPYQITSSFTKSKKSRTLICKIYSCLFLHLLKGANCLLHVE